MMMMMHRKKKQEEEEEEGELLEFGLFGDAAAAEEENCRVAAVHLGRKKDFLHRLCWVSQFLLRRSPITSKFRQEGKGGRRKSLLRRCK